MVENFRAGIHRALPRYRVPLAPLWEFSKDRVDASTNVQNWQRKK
jgi:hypothetical protein